MTEILTPEVEKPDEGLNRYLQFYQNISKGLVWTNVLIWFLNLDNLDVYYVIKRKKINYFGPLYEQFGILKIDILKLRVGF